jgi:hypothetical protein
LAIAVGTGAASGGAVAAATGYGICVATLAGGRNNVGSLYYFNWWYSFCCRSWHSLQVLGRVIEIAAVIILLFFLYPTTFKIIFPAAILVGIKHINKHIKRTKTFLRGKVV